MPQNGYWAAMVNRHQLPSCWDDFPSSSTTLDITYLPALRERYLYTRRQTGYVAPSEDATLAQLLHLYHFWMDTRFEEQLESWSSIHWGPAWLQCSLHNARIPDGADNIDSIRNARLSTCYKYIPNAQLVFENEEGLTLTKISTKTNGKTDKHNFLLVHLEYAAVSG